ncbi:MAG: BrnT family toxin [Terrimicrobiaceae bacterium]
MEFEYDPAKSKINLEKHGIDFDHAQLLWLDDQRIVVPARSITEPREAIIAQRDGIFWTAIYTLRGDSIRLISVRRSRDEEREGYNNR